MGQRDSFAAIILAGGLGKRMESKTPKVLHHVGSHPMIVRTVNSVKVAGPQMVITVANPLNFTLLEKIIGGKSQFAIQKNPLGTADAVKTALEKIPKTIETIAVVYGDDSAFYNPSTISEVFDFHRTRGSVITFVSLASDKPDGMGRVLREDGRVVGIVEDKDATPEQKNIKEINDGLYFFDSKWLRVNIDRLQISPKTGEYYLTQIINLAAREEQKVEAFMLKDPAQWHSINTPEDLDRANELLKKRVHFMGIGGAGASAVAAIAKKHGYHVNGCDSQRQTAYKNNLEGITVWEGHSTDHLHGIGLLVISAAILKNDPKNKEIAYAKKHKIPVLLWEQFQEEYLVRDKILITVSGAYGKSTTTAMIGKILTDAGVDPTCEVGAKVLEWRANYRVGLGAHYVLEADEYMDKFQIYSPDIAVILNIGWDHPDFFKTKKSVENSYKKFIKRIKPAGTLIIPKELSYLSTDKSLNVFHIESFSPYELSIIGDFRKENADAAMTLSKVLGIEKGIALAAIEKFKGLGRRLEFKGKIGKTYFYDDYAVQPFTVLKTSHALKKKYRDKKVLLVLEPHTFSRVNTFYDDFVDSLSKADVDEIYVTDVFPAREKGDGAALSVKLAKDLNSKAVYTGSVEETATLLSNNFESFDVVLTMGAGNVYKVYDLLMRGN